MQVIADHELRDRDPVGHLKKLQEASAAIEHWGKMLLADKNADPKLKHYLERRSYDKALDWLARIFHHFQDGEPIDGLWKEWMRRGISELEQIKNPFFLNRPTREQIEEVMVKRSYQFRPKLDREV